MCILKKTSSNNKSFVNYILYIIVLDMSYKWINLAQTCKHLFPLSKNPHPTIAFFLLLNHNVRSIPNNLITIYFSAVEITQFPTLNVIFIVQ